MTTNVIIDESLASQKLLILNNKENGMDSCR